MIIGISGKMGSGKNTVADIIEKLCLTNKGPKFEQKLFAGKLKTIASILTGIRVSKFEDQEFKKTDLPNEWVYIENGYAARNMTVRDFLQKLGTEAMRDGLHENVWVNALMADYKWYVKEWDELGNETVGEYPNWIITDMRFPNEMEAVVERQGITIRVVRPKPREMFLMNATTVIDTRIPEHPSETALDNAEFDYIIDNDGTLDELVEKVREILILEKIIS